jgi:hypothetical protein
MPVILDEGAAENWMNAGERDLPPLKSLMAPAPDDNLQMSLKNDLISDCFSQPVKIGRRSDSKCASLHVLGKFFKTKDCLEKHKSQHRPEAELTEVKREGLHLNNIVSITLIRTCGAVSEIPFIRKAERYY